MAFFRISDLARAFSLVTEAKRGWIHRISASRLFLCPVSDDFQAKVVADDGTALAV